MYSTTHFRLDGIRICFSYFVFRKVKNTYSCVFESLCVAFKFENPTWRPQYYFIASFLFSTFLSWCIDFILSIQLLFLSCQNIFWNYSPNCTRPINYGKIFFVKVYWLAARFWERKDEHYYCLVTSLFFILMRSNTGERHYS